MTKTSYVYDHEKGCVVPASDYKSKEATPDAPFVISDEMDAAMHPSDGKMYTSKSEFRKTTRANGCIEVGDQMHTIKKKERDHSADIVDDLKRAFHETGVYRD